MSLKRFNFEKKSACQRRTGVETKKKANKHFDETLTARQMFEAFIRGEYDPATVDEVKEDVAVSYSEQNIDDIAEVQEASVNTLSKCMFRLLNSWPYSYGSDGVCFVPEGPIFLDLTEWIDSKEGAHFDGDDDIEVRFTCIRKDIDDTPGKTGNIGTLEGITLRKGSPAGLGKTAKGENNVFNNTWLHLQRLALRKYADSFLEPGQAVTIVSSYYFIRKTTDKSDQAYQLSDYFSDDNGIRQLSEVYTKMPDDQEFPDTEYDGMLRELLDKFATGYDKCELKEESDCKGCPEYLSCYFKEPPHVLEASTHTGIKARGSIDRDEYQDAVVRYKEGTGVVDAPPGSGKTEVTTERTVLLAFDILNDLVKRYEAGEDVDVPVTCVFECKDSRGFSNEELLAELEGSDSDGKVPEQAWESETETV